MIIGKDIYYYDQVDSTNKIAKDLALKGEKEGTVIIADSQTKGKGRRGKSWSSPQGEGIWMSLILRPKVKPSDLAAITLVAGLAVCKAIRFTSDLKAFIKWPNDIVVNGKKICGILTEMHGDIKEVNHVIVGIGINVNTKEFPKEIQEIATSLKIEKGKNQEKDLIINKVLDFFDFYYKEFLKEGLSKVIIDEYKDLCISLKNKVRVTSKEETFIGSPLDIDSSGSLIVKKEDGTYKTVLSGEVSVRGIYGYV